MAGREPVGAIRRSSNSVSGYEDRPKFIRCVDGRKPQVHEVWTFGEDGLIPKVHLTARVDVGTGIVDKFATNCLTEDWLRIPIFGRKSINGSVEWLGVPAPLRTDGPPCTDNILVPSPDWGAGGNATNPNWGIQPSVPYGIVSVP